MLSLAVAQQCVSRPRATSMCPLLPGRQIHLGANFAWRQICLGGKSQCVSCQQLEAASGSLRRLFLKSELVKDLHSVLSSHDVSTMSPVFHKDKSWFETNFITFRAKACAATDFDYQPCYQCGKMFCWRAKLKEVLVCFTQMQMERVWQDSPVTAPT